MPGSGFSQAERPPERRALAGVALEEASYVVRATYGLHTLEQVPLIQQAIAKRRALGDLTMVQALEEQLLDLANRHPGDLRNGRDSSRCRRSAA